jgi:hypothetical protein
MPPNLLGAEVNHRRMRSSHEALVGEAVLRRPPRHLSFSAGSRTISAYLETLQRLLAFGLDRCRLTGGELERWGGGDWSGSLSNWTQAPS